MSEKTEAPTARRISEARKEGRVALSSRVEHCGGDARWHLAVDGARKNPDHRAAGGYG